MGKRINTIMQTCFFAISGVLPKEEAIKQIKKAIEKSYLIKGQSVVDKNFLAVNTTLENLFPVTIKPILTHSENLPIANSRLPQFVQDFTIPLMNDLGDELPVSKMPNDGTFPSGTTQWEKEILPMKCLSGNLTYAFNAEIAVLFAHIVLSELNFLMKNGKNRYRNHLNRRPLMRAVFLKHYIL